MVFSFFDAPVAHSLWEPLSEEGTWEESGKFLSGEKNLMFCLPDSVAKDGHKRCVRCTSD
jgi:hypothetical protein